MLCILYVTAVGTLLGLAGVLAERVLPATFPRRWMWCAIVLASVSLPGYYRANHTASMHDLLGAPSPQGAASLPGALDPDWWVRAQAYDPLIGRIWLISSALLLVWGLANAARIWGIVHTARVAAAGSRARTVVEGVPVVITEGIGPATVGFWRSRVLVPRWVLALPGAQRRYVLRHEDEHRRAHDAKLLLVMSLSILLTPWNLALWWQLRRLRLAVELDCDNRVVARLGNAEAYGDLLLKVAQAANRGPRLQPAFLGGAGMLERRLVALMAPAPLRHAQRFLLPVAAVVLLFVVMTMPHPVVESPTNGAPAHPAHSAQTSSPRR